MRTHMFALVAAGVVLACSSPTSVCGCSPAPFAAAIVTGTVRTANDVPLADATVITQSSVGGCPARTKAGPLYQTSTKSDATGSYRLPVNALDYKAESLCVTVFAQRSGSSGIETVSTTTVALQLRTGPPFDSARVDLRFP